MQGNEPSPYNPGATIAGTPFVVLFSWSAVSALQRQYGKRECFQKMAAVLSDRDIDGISELAALAVAGQTAESFKALSLPMNPTIEAFQDAWLIFLNGPDKTPPADKVEGDANPPKALSTSFGSLLKHFFGRAAAGPNSGSEAPSKLN